MKPNEMYIFPSPTIHGSMKSMNNQPTWRQTTQLPEGSLLPSASGLGVG